MSFLKILKKREVPDELPALVSDEIKKKLEKTKEKDLDKIEQEVQVQVKPKFDEKDIIQIPNDSRNSNQPTEEINKEPILEKETIENKPVDKKPENEDNLDNDFQIKKESIPPEKIEILKNNPRVCKDSFFIKLQENLSKEMGNLDKLEEWYNNKLLPKDALSEMKDYWEKQTSSSIIQALGKDFQDKITNKIIILQDLEKKWQDSYFDLIEKEGKIKEEEKELKKMLEEFIRFCKKRVNDEKIPQEETKKNNHALDIKVAEIKLVSEKIKHKNNTKIKKRRKGA